MGHEFNIDNEFANYNWLGTKSNANAYVGMPSWGNTPAYGALEFTKIPSFADKLRDFNSQYGSTITGGLQAASGLWGAFNGMQQTKLAKQQMANSLNQWNKNYANQVASYNTRLEDRQAARVASNPNAYESVDSYMQKNRLK